MTDHQSVFKKYDWVFFTFGNLCCYIPLYMITRMASKGLFASLNGIHVSSFEILPLYAVGNIILTFSFLTISGWWKYSNKRMLFGKTISFPRTITIISGLCTVAQIFSAIWAYAFTGISIVFVALLMKGGVLCLAPIVDKIVKKRKRQIYWPSITAALISLSAIVISFMEKIDIAITLVCVFDIIVYLSSYFIKTNYHEQICKNARSK